jgi:hypothetical protein
MEGFRRLLFGRYNLGGIDLRLEQAFNYIQTTGSSRVSDFDSSAKNYTANKNLSNENNRRTFSYVPALSVSKSFSKNRSSGSRSISLQARFMEDIKSEKNSSTIAWRNLDRSFRFFKYDAGLNFYIYNARETYL